MKNNIIATIVSLNLLILCSTSAITGQLQGPRQGHPTKSVLEQRLKPSGHAAQFVQIYGSGPLWKRTIGLSIADGIEIHDKKLIASLLQTLHGTGETKWSDMYFKGGSITISFMRKKSDGMDDFIDDFNYIRRDNYAYCVYRVDDDPTDTMAALRSGSDLNFEAFIRQMAKRARSHERSVSFFQVHGD